MFCFGVYLCMFSQYLHQPGLENDQRLGINAIQSQPKKSNPKNHPSFNHMYRHNKDYLLLLFLPLTPRQPILIIRLRKHLLHQLQRRPQRQPNHIIMTPIHLLHQNRP